MFTSQGYFGGQGPRNSDFSNYMVSITDDEQGAQGAKAFEYIITFWSGIIPISNGRVPTNYSYDDHFIFQYVS